MLKPDDARGHYGLGKALLRMGNKGAALEQYQILLALDPDIAKEFLKEIDAKAQ